MRILQINRLRIPFPQSWNELTQKQLLRIATFYAQTMDYNLMRQVIFCELSGLKILKRKEIEHPVDSDHTGYWFKYFDNTFRISAIDLGWMLQFVDFIFASYERNGFVTYYIKSQIYEQKIPFILLNGVKYYGPHGLMANLPWIEWQTCMIHYKNYKAQAEISHLDKLCASLYREQRKDISIEDPKFYEEPRQEFIDFAVDQRAERFKKMDMSYKIAILFYFEGCVALLETLYPEAFSSPDKKKEDGPPKDINIGLVLEDVIAALSDNDPKLFDTYRQKNVHDILRGLCKSIKKQQK